MKKWTIIDAEKNCEHQEKIQTTTRAGITRSACSICRSWIGIGGNK
jgi:hypothetical protein